MSPSEVNEAGRPLPRVVLRCALMNLAAALLVIGAGEALVRATTPGSDAASQVAVGSHEPGARVHWFQGPFAPGRSAEYDNWVVNNRYGFHGPDHPPRREPGRKRVAILGDSFIEAYQVTREETVGARLETLLPATEVLDFGWAAYSTTRQIRLLDRLPELLRDEAGADLPDVVVLQCHGPFALRQALADDVLRPALWRRGLTSALHHLTLPSAILVRVKVSVLTRLAEPEGDLLQEADRLMDRGHRSDFAEEGWAILDRSVKEIADRARALKMRPVFAYLPTVEDLRPESPALDPGIPARRFRDMALGAGADFVDLSPEFRRAAAAGEAPSHFTVDQHLTPHGHEIFARALAAALRPMLEGR